VYTSQYLSIFLEALRKPTKNIRISGVPAEIRNEDIPNASLRHCYYTDTLDFVQYVHSARNKILLYIRSGFVYTFPIALWSHWESSQRLTPALLVPELEYEVATY
jgi:hypothetical protein